MLHFYFEVCEMIISEMNSILSKTTKPTVCLSVGKMFCEDRDVNQFWLRSFPTV